MVYEILARDGASPAFKTVGAEAKNLQRVMLEADAKMTAASKAATAEISASLAGLDRAHNAAALQYDRANQTMIRSDDSLIVMQRKMAASTGALLAEQKKAAAANVEMDAAMGKAQTELAAKTAASHASRVSAFKDLGKASAAALLIVGYESVKAATRFEASMARVQTMAGASAKELKFMSGAILDLSPKVGVGPDALAESLYHVESAGFRGQKALDMVTASAKLSALGQDDINSSTQAVVATLASNIKGVRDANDAAALILHTVGTGDMTMHQFTQALGTGILATASTVGLAFKDIGAAIATLTDNAIPADQAATKLRTSLLMMVNPSGPAIAALRSINMNSTQLAMDLQKPDGLKVALDDIRKHLNSAFPLNKGPVASIDAQRRAVDSYKTTLMGAGVSGKELDKMVAKYTEALKHGTTNTVLQEQAFAKMFGGSKNAGTMMVLFNEQLDRMNPKLASFGTATSRAAEMQAAWAKQQSTFKQQLKDLNSALDTAKVKIGNELLPVLKTVVGFMSSHLRVIKDLSVAVGIMAAAWVVYGAAMGISSIIKTLTAAQWSLNTAMDANPIGVVVIGLAALAFAAYELITHWKQVTAFTKRMWHDVAGFFKQMWKDVTGFADRIANDVNGFFARMWHDVTGLVGKVRDAVVGKFNEIKGFVGRILGDIGRLFHDHWRLLLVAATLGVGLIYVLIQDHWKQISGLTARLWHDVSGFFQRMWLDVSGFAIRMALDVARPVERMWHEVSGFASRMWRDVSGFVSRMWHDVAGFVTRMALDAADIAIRMWHTVSAPVERLWHDVSGFVSSMWHDVTGQSTQSSSAVTGTVKKLSGGVTGFFSGLADGVGAIFGRMWTSLEGTAVSSANRLIGILNTFLDAINSIAGLVHESLNLHINPIAFGGGNSGGPRNSASATRLAAGGMIPASLVGGGFVTDGPRAIVGEGNPAHPEFVIPTDPQHRGRAQGLFRELGPQLLAAGGIIDTHQTGWRSIIEAVRDTGQSFGYPADTQITHGTHAAGSEHYQGRAVDFGTATSNPDAIFRALRPYAMGGRAAIDELFWDPSGEGWKNGSNIGPIGHHSDHVHVGIPAGEDLAGMLTGGPGHGPGLLGQIRAGIGGLVNNGLSAAAHHIADPVKSLIKHLTGERGQVMALLGGAAGTGIDAVVNSIIGKADGGGGAPGGKFAGAMPTGGLVTRWAGLVASVLAELGLSGSLVPKVLRQIQTESGGDPNATQGAIGDVNNRTGDLARGLMQVIGSTFRGNAGPYVGLGQYNPHASLYAGLNYARQRYGPDLSFLGQGHGYDTGGILPSGRVGINRSGQPERILSPSQTAAFERLVAQLEGSRGCTGCTKGRCTSPRC